MYRYGWTLDGKQVLKKNKTAHPSLHVENKSIQ